MFSTTNGITVTSPIIQIKINPRTLDIPSKKGTRKRQESSPMRVVSIRFFIKNATSNPLEYMRVALSERYQIGIQESPVASADQTTQNW